MALQQNLNLPDFSQFDPNRIPEQLEQLLGQSRSVIEALVAKPNLGYFDFMPQLEAIEDSIDQLFGPLSHLHGVANSPTVRDAYDACLPKITDYSTWLSQNQELYQAMQRLLEEKQFNELPAAQQQSLRLQIRDFKLSGVALPEDGKHTFAKLKQEMAKISSTFSNQLMDATDAWYMHLEDDKRLTGLPASNLAQATQLATNKGLSGYVLNLDFACYYAVQSFADDRDLRHEVYKAYTTRASEQGPNAGEFDNGPLLGQLGKLRHQMASLLGFDSYASYSVARKMADVPEQILTFLQNLAKQCKPIAQQELNQLHAFVQQQNGPSQLMAWDVPYYSEKLRQARYDISQEEIKPYLPLPKVLDGLFGVVERLFGIQVSQVSQTEHQYEGISVWHRDVQFFRIQENGQPVGYFYLDLFAREQKRGGAWMAECRSRQVLSDGHLQLPVAYLVCNFAPATKGKPALLTHTDLVTLFHEFGHGLHHILTEIDVPHVSGINGVPWDAVELPSQLLENWAWQQESLQSFARHYETDAPLPQALLDKMLDAKHFQSAMFMVRQLEFALFDFILHYYYQPQQPQDVQSVLDEVRDMVSVIKPPAWNRFQNGFSHIFAGGYAAGYYSYLWSDVLAADVFERFINDGVFNQETGLAFRKKLLSQGGSTDAMTLFKNFMGREPDVNALLRAKGLTLKGEMP